MGRLMRVRTIVNIPILTVSSSISISGVAYLMPPASGTEYVPFGPGLLDPPTNTIEQKLIKATNMSIGNVPFISSLSICRHTLVEPIPPFDPLCSFQSTDQRSQYRSGSTISLMLASTV